VLADLAVALRVQLARAEIIAGAKATTDGGKVVDRLAAKLLRTLRSLGVVDKPPRSVAPKAAPAPMPAPTPSAAATAPTRVAAPAPKVAAPPVPYKSGKWVSP
jgi:hypothetical protein